MLSPLNWTGQIVGPGGSLDSQTTETQWYEAVTGTDGRFSEYLQDGTPLIGVCFLLI